MKTIGWDAVEPLVGRDTFKVIVNEAGIVFFAKTCRHCEVKAEGMSYEEDSAGNALAVTVTSTTFEIRNHRGFPMERVLSLLRKLQAIPELAPLWNLRITYQGQMLATDQAHLHNIS